MTNSLHPLFAAPRTDARISESAPCTRTDAPAPKLRPRHCEWCGESYTPETARAAKEQQVCKPACRAARSRASYEERERRRQRALKADGQRKALGKYHAEARIAAFMALRMVGGAPLRFTSSDLRSYCEVKGVYLDWSKNWVGGMFQRCPWFETKGRTVHASHPGSRARRVLVYWLSDEGRAVFAEMRKGE